MLQQTQVARVLERYEPVARALADARGARRRRPRPTSCAPGRASATTAARSTSRTPPGASSSSASSRATSPTSSGCRESGPYTARAIACFAFGAAGDGARHERAPRARALARHDRRRAAGRAAPGTGTRRSSTSARRSAWRACRAASAARWPASCPSRGRTFAPLRRQSRFEGSRRQRRAALVRELADGPRAGRRLRSRRGRLAARRRPGRAPRRRPARTPRGDTGTVSIPVYATNAVSCLAVKPGEHFQALVDEPFAEVGARLCDAALAAGAASAACVVVPDVGAPAARLLRAVRGLARRDRRALLLVHAHPRRRVRGLPQAALRARAAQTGTRVAFGGRMDRSILEHEMAADYGAVRELTRELWPRGSRAARHVRVTTPGGTDCTFDVTGREWKLDDGVLDRPAPSATCPRARSSSRRSRRAPTACA